MPSQPSGHCDGESRPRSGSPYGLETRHDRGHHLDADENVNVNASGLAVVDDLSWRCREARLVSEERRLWPSSHGLGLRDTGHVETDRPWTLAPTQTLSVTNSALIKCFHWYRYRALLGPARQSVS